MESKFKCPHCGQHFTGDFIWKEVECPNCFKTIKLTPSDVVVEKENDYGHCGFFSLLWFWIKFIVAAVLWIGWFSYGKEGEALLQWISFFVCVWFCKNCLKFPEVKDGGNNPQPQPRKVNENGKA